MQVFKSNTMYLGLRCFFKSQEQNFYLRTRTGAWNRPGAGCGAACFPPVTENNSEGTAAGHSQFFHTQTRTLTFTAADRQKLRKPLLKVQLHIVSLFLFLILPGQGPMWVPATRDFPPELGLQHYLSVSDSDVAKVASLLSGCEGF